MQTVGTNAEMTRILNIFLVVISFSNCSQKFHSSELKENFNKAEVKDLQRLTDFFQVQVCGNSDHFKDCTDSVIPYLGEFGWRPILDNVDFEKQRDLYKSFQSDLFLEIWNFCKARNLREDMTYKSLCLNMEGKYVQFLQDLSNRNSDLKEYYEMIIGSGDWESMGLLQSRIYTNPEYYDLNDPSIQVLISVHYLTQNDQQKRKDLWNEN